MDKKDVKFDEFGVPVDNIGTGGKILMAIIGAIVGAIIGYFSGVILGAIVTQPYAVQFDDLIEEAFFGCFWGMILGIPLAMIVYDRLNGRIRSIMEKIGITISGATIGSGIGAILMAYIDVLVDCWLIVFIGEIIGIIFAARIFNRQKGAKTDKQDSNQLI